MAWLAYLGTEKFLLFTLVLTRVSGLMMTAPVYGTKDVPMTVRAMLSFALALLVMPIEWNASLADPGTMLNYAAIMASELLVGVCLGLGILVLIAGIQMAGELLSRVGGLTLSDVFDPTFDTSIPLFSRLLAMISTTVFIAVGGHRMLLGGLLETFQSMPPGRLLPSLLGGGSGGGGLLAAMTEAFVLLLTESFQLAIRASVPVVAAVLVATVVLGLISRTLPQLNVLMLGFGLNAMLTFGVLALSLGAVAVTFQEQVEPTLETMFQVFKGSP